MEPWKLMFIKKALEENEKYKDDDYNISDDENQDDNDEFEEIDDYDIDFEVDCEETDFILNYDDEE